MSHPYHQPDHQPLLDYQVSKTSERVDILNYPREGQSQIAIPTTSASDRYLDPALPYHLQADWARFSSITPLPSHNSYTSSSSDSTVFSLSPSIYSPTYSTVPSPTPQAASQPPNFQPTPEKLACRTARRRAQNRESQRAFRERQNHQITELEAKLADLQDRHEKLLQLCFVELSDRLVTTTSGNNEHNGTISGA